MQPHERQLPRVRGAGVPRVRWPAAVVILAAMVAGCTYSGVALRGASCIRDYHLDDDVGGNGAVIMLVDLRPGLFDHGVIRAVR